MAVDRSKGKMISRGRTAEIFRWGNDRILKLFAADFPTTKVGYEAWVTKAAYDAGLPVPAVDEVVEVEGRQGIVFEHISGPILSVAMFSRPWEYPGLAKAMAELHARVHACELPGLNSWQHELIETLRGLTSIKGDTKFSLLEILKQSPDGNALCHADFHPDNIIVSPKGPVIIDWLTAKSGNPIADLARTSLLLRVGTPPGCNAVSRWLHTLGGSLVFEAYIKRYRQLRAFSHEEMDKWLSVVAAARLAENIPEEKRKLLAIIDDSVR